MRADEGDSGVFQGEELLATWGRRVVTIQALPVVRVVCTPDLPFVGAHFGKQMNSLAAFTTTKVKEDRIVGARGGHAKCKHLPESTQPYFVISSHTNSATPSLPEPSVATDPQESAAGLPTKHPALMSLGLS